VFKEIDRPVRLGGGGLEAGGGEAGAEAGSTPAGRVGQTPVWPGSQPVYPATPTHNQRTRR
jgi:hypothetical protein